MRAQHLLAGKTVIVSLRTLDTSPINVGIHNREFKLEDWVENLRFDDVPEVPYYLSTHRAIVEYQNRMMGSGMDILDTDVVFGTVGSVAYCIHQSEYRLQASDKQTRQSLIAFLRAAIVGFVRPGKEAA